MLYTTPGGKVRLEIFLKDETIWLSQDKIAQLFGVDRTVITKHLKNIYQSGELNEVATSAKFAQVQTEGSRQVTRFLVFYNLDAIISVGYRVNSAQATHFRIWATERFLARTISPNAALLITLFVILDPPAGGESL